MTAIALPRRRRSALAPREARWGVIFIAPWIIGFLAFTLIPMVATFVFTFTNINLEQKQPLAFVGLDNYRTLLNDGQAWDSLGVTLRFALIALPVGVILPFVVALLLSSRHLRGAGLFRVLFFLPYVVPFVAGVLIWQTMLNPTDGWIDVFLRLIGVADPPDWLRDTSWVYAGLVLMGLWGIGGGVIVYLAGLRGIPSELYDAARIGWRGLRRPAPTRDHSAADAGHLLHAGAGHRRGPAVLPRPARAQPGHRRTGRLDALPEPLHLQERSSTIHEPRLTARRWPGCSSGSPC